MIEQGFRTTSLGAAFSTIKKAAAPLRRQVLDELRQSIISGRSAPGNRLVERELIEMLGVSRTVIREALRQLETEGLIAILPNKGPIVRELTASEAKDLYSIRAVLEGLAARLFVQNASNAQVEELERELDRTANAYQSNDPEQILETKNRFYDVLFDGARSETLSSMIAILHTRIWRWRALGLSHPRRSDHRWRESIGGLRLMLIAVKNRDADLAERLIREEVTRANAEVMRLIAADQAPASEK
ncbi:MAG TPA: GntR family transcriptional regulator [Terriglobales bacterium]|nr:GntR family transcriptional regulator [Terriglobales bacterium]